MKSFAVLLLCLLFAHGITGQVMFRNDFVIHRNPARLENKGLTYVTFNVGSRHIWNLNAYGQPIKSIRVDVTALLGRKSFGYQDIIESMYRPMAVYKQSYVPIPLYLFLEPPRKLKSYSARRRTELLPLVASDF